MKRSNCWKVLAVVAAVAAAGAAIYYLLRMRKKSSCCICEADDTFYADDAEGYTAAADPVCCEEFSDDASAEDVPNA